jgi:hypothetical protein
MVIATALGWGNAASIAISIALALCLRLLAHVSTRAPRVSKLDGAYRDRTGDLRLAKPKRAVWAVWAWLRPLRSDPLLMRVARCSNSVGRNGSEGYLRRFP